MDVIDNVSVPWGPPHLATAVTESYSSIPLHTNSEQTRRSDFPKSPFSVFTKPNRPLPPPFIVLIIFFVAIVVFERYVERAPIVLMSSEENLLESHSMNRPNTDVVRFMTFNTFIRPVGVGYGDHKDERLRDLLGQLGSFDIVCFQELFTSSGFRKVKFLQELELVYGFDNYVTSPSPGIEGLFFFPPKIIDGGLVIASRFDILEADYRTYSRSNILSIDCFVAKGVLYARLAVPMRNTSKCFIHLFTTHMQANNGLGIDFVTTRQSQLQELVEFVVKKTSSDPGAPIILAGDFNVDGRLDFYSGSSSLEYQQMMEMLHKVPLTSLLRDILFRANGNKHPVTSAGGLLGNNQRNERLDYIFFSPGNRSDTRSPCTGTLTDIKSSVRVEQLKISGRPYRTLSDHYAVVANFKIESKGNCSRNR